jgi:hypothetical protein
MISTEQYMQPSYRSNIQYQYQPTPRKEKYIQVEQYKKTIPIQKKQVVMKQPQQAQSYTTTNIRSPYYINPLGTNIPKNDTLRSKGNTQKKQLPYEKYEFLPASAMTTDMLLDRYGSLREGYGEEKNDIETTNDSRSANNNGSTSNESSNESQNESVLTIPVSNDNRDAQYQIYNAITPTNITPVYYSQPEEMKSDGYSRYLQSLSPNVNTYSDVASPINANLGISYTPQIPPLVYDQVGLSGDTETRPGDPNGININQVIQGKEIIRSNPLYHRIDPQLVRDKGIPVERLMEQPRRTAVSAKYADLEAPSGVNYEDIYDPKFNSYGDGYRSYVDIDQGNVQYYYTDIDAYRKPNFISRTKVDHMIYKDPMGKELPEYGFNTSLQDVKREVQEQYLADDLMHREDIMERQMRKRNSELWAQRVMPLSSANHSTVYV